MSSPSTLPSSRSQRRLRGSLPSSILPTSYPLSSLPPAAPDIIVNSPGLLSPQTSPPSPVHSTGPASAATASGASTTPSSCLNLTSSHTLVSSCSASPSIVSTRKVMPISASQIERYDRVRPIPQMKDRVFIESGNKVFEDKPPSSRWKPLTHPEGALYYYDKTHRIYTDADLSHPSTLTAIEAIADQIYHKAKGDPNIEITDKTELVIEDINENTCGYYFVEPEKRCIFWIERFDATPIFRNVRRVRNMGHISNLLSKLSTGEAHMFTSFVSIQAGLRTHCELFPHENRVTQDVLDELKQMIIHAAAVTLTSATSVAPFGKEELEKMLDLVDSIKGTVEGPFAHTRCVVARFMSEFTSAKFFNFCGQPGARLDSDKTIYSRGHEHQSILFIIASILLFSAPYSHQEDLKVIWVDRTINRVLWKEFIGKLGDQWAGLALSATVILNANVAFLAITSLRAAARLLSYLSVACSIGVVIIVLLLVRQNQTRDCGSAEQAITLLRNVSQSFLGTETLAITYGLPYGLLMWGLVSFAAAFATLIFGTEGKGTRGAVGFVGLLVICFVVLVMRIGKHQNNSEEDDKSAV